MRLLKNKYNLSFTNEVASALNEVFSGIGPCLLSTKKKSESRLNRISSSFNKVKLSNLKGERLYHGSIIIINQKVVVGFYPS